MSMKSQNKGSCIVYSTEFGKMCPGCNNPTVQCSCQKKQLLSETDGVVRLKRETKGRKGKGVTLITGLPLKNDELKKLAKVLKQKCGSGGCLKDGVIEIQGDHRDVLEKELDKIGYKAKRAGG